MAPLLHHLLSLTIRGAPVEDPPVTTEPTTSTSMPSNSFNAGVVASRDQNNQNTSTHHLSKKTTMIIIAACVGVLILSLPFLICCCLRSRRRKRKNYSTVNHASSHGHTMQTEWKVSDQVHGNASKPTKPAGKQNAQVGVGYQHDPEAEQGLLSDASAPGHSSTGLGGYGHGYSGSTTSIPYQPRPSTDSTGSSGRPHSYASPPPIYITAPQPMKPSLPEYEGSHYGNPSPGPQNPAHPHAPLQQSTHTSPPPGPMHQPPPQNQTQPPPLRPNVGPTNQGGPVPLYLQHTTGGEADDYYSARGVAAREAMGQDVGEGS